MGYFSTHNLFRLYDLVSNSFIKKGEVIFHECVLGHHGFANNRLPMDVDITSSTHITYQFPQSWLPRAIRA